MPVGARPGVEGCKPGWDWPRLLGEMVEGAESSHSLTTREEEGEVEEEEEMGL